MLFSQMTFCKNNQQQWTRQVWSHTIRCCLSKRRFKVSLRRKACGMRGAWSWITGQIEALSNRKGDTDGDLKIRSKRFIADVVHDFMSNTEFPERDNSTSLPQRYRYLVKPKKEVEIKCAISNRLVWETIISDERVGTLERKGQNVLTTLFNQLTDSDGSAKLLPADFRKMIEAVEQSSFISMYVELTLQCMMMFF